MNNRTEASRPKIEVRSIDYVPRRERHGKVWHQAPFWFTGNFVLTTMVVGFTGPALGLGAVYSMLAIVIGVCFGTFFMACHANQGPRMGLPQMIQSRAQFGLRGAIVPFTAVVFVYVGFNVFKVILATDAINTVWPGHRVPWYLLLIAVAVLLAVVGHDLLHSVQRWLTYAMHVNLALVTVKQNEVVKRLAGWGAILAIPTVIFSLYGMNFANMPELKFPWAYHTILGVTAVGCFFLYQKLKKSGWL
jgi:nucleobase:cation symporter-1, NCS1 family